MSNKFFTREEAQEMVEKRFKNKRDFSGIPEGTVGVVSGFDSHGPKTQEDPFTLQIRCATENNTVVSDWFDKEEMRKWMEETEDPITKPSILEEEKEQVDKLMRFGGQLLGDVIEKSYSFQDIDEFRTYLLMLKGSMEADDAAELQDYDVKNQ